MSSYRVKKKNPHFLNIMCILLFPSHSFYVISQTFHSRWM